jgi:F0F1-type ATP synthase assembly protein I
MDPNRPTDPHDPADEPSASDDGLPDRIEELPGWREPPKAPEIPEILRRPVEHPSLKQADSARTSMASLSEAGKAWGIALDFVATVIVGMLLGWLLAKWLGYTSAFVLGGLALGLVTAFIRIVRATQRAEKREAAARNAARNKPPTERH